MVKQGEMRVVGTLKGTPIERFGRNQRRAALVAPPTGQPPGVLRFRTWEEFAAWKTEKRIAKT